VLGAGTVTLPRCPGALTACRDPPDPRPPPFHATRYCLGRGTRCGEAETLPCLSPSDGAGMGMGSRVWGSPASPPHAALPAGPPGTALVSTPPCPTKATPRASLGQESRGPRPANLCHTRAVHRHKHGPKSTDYGQDQSHIYRPAPGDEHSQSLQQLGPAPSPQQGPLPRAPGSPLPRNASRR